MFLKVRWNLSRVNASQLSQNRVNFIILLLLLTFDTLFSTRGFSILTDSASNNLHSVNEAEKKEELKVLLLTKR